MNLREIADAHDLNYSTLRAWMTRRSMPLQVAYQIEHHFPDETALTLAGYLPSPAVHRLRERYAQAVELDDLPAIALVAAELLQYVGFEEQSLPSSAQHLR